MTTLRPNVLCRVINDRRARDCIVRTVHLHSPGMWIVEAMQHVPCQRWTSFLGFFRRLVDAVATPGEHLLAPAARLRPLHDGDGVDEVLRKVGKPRPLQAPAAASPGHCKPARGAHVTSHYDTLGVPEDASEADIKAARRRLASEHHPDRGGDTEAMAAVNRAYDVLIDPARRAAYDETGRAREASLDDKAQALLHELMRRALEEGGNCVAVIRTRMNAAISTMRSRIPRLREHQDELRQRRAQIRVRSGANVAHKIIDAQIAQADAEIELATSTIDVTVRAAKLLDEYEDDERVTFASASVVFGGGWPR